jgi:polar amino acid transport system permease protein
MIAWSARSVLVQAALVTIEIFAVSVVLALLMSFVLGLARNSKLAPVRILAQIWCELFRGVSLTVLLFWFYFVLPLFGPQIPAFVAAVLALGFCFGAYGADTVRAGIQTVSNGQRNAALALGLTPARAFLQVVLPQALRIMVPGLGNLSLLVLKSTSVTALITIPELSFQANAITNNYGASLSVFAFVIIAYYGMAKVIIFATRLIERAVAYPS